jgi:hypothetical protein
LGVFDGFGHGSLSFNRLAGLDQQAASLVFDNETVEVTRGRSSLVLAKAVVLRSVAWAFEAL